MSFSTDLRNIILLTRVLNLTDYIRKKINEGNGDITPLKRI